MSRIKHLQTLGLDSTASETDIKKAFRRLSLQHHPDKNNNSPDSSEKFNEINNAYSFLTNKDGEQEKEFFDNLFTGMNMNRNGNDNGGGNPMGPHNFFRNGGNGGGVDDILFNMMFMGEMLNNMNMGEGFPEGVNVKVFHNGVPVNIGGQKSRSKPKPLIVSLDVTLKESYTGGSVPLNITRWYGNPHGNTETETIYVTIPEGIDDNEFIIIENKGNVIDESCRGDLKVVIKIKNDTCFVRDGLNLVLNKSITLKEALCGINFSIQHLSGKSYTIKNNKIVHPGTSSFINNLGFKRDGNIGKLNIIFSIEFPDDISNEVKQKIARININLNCIFILMLSLTVSIVETIFIKSAIFTVEKLAYGTYYALGSMVNYYYPKD